MPELPEIEVLRRTLEPALNTLEIVDATSRTPRLRLPIDPDLGESLRGKTIISIERRGKYLLLECRRPTPGPSGHGYLIIHLGMSGTLRIVDPNLEPSVHDHFDLVFADRLLRYRDPRRFGLIVWHPGGNIENHPLLAALGAEPFSPLVDGAWLHRALAPRSSPIKPVLMDNRLLVGVGNIYASESLFRAGISPMRPANALDRRRCGRLLLAVRETLTEAIAAGGSSLRDYVHADGGAGCFQLEHAVYHRAGEACIKCRTPIEHLRQAGRSTYFCPGCQR